MRSLGFVQFRQSHMGVLSRVAVTWKVLRTEKNIVCRVRVSPFDEGRDVGGDCLRIFAEGARVDDGIVGIVVDVRIGREGPVNTKSARLAGGGCAESFASRARSRAAPNAIRYGKRAVSATRIEAPRSKSEPTSNGSLATPLHVVDKDSHFKGLRKDHVAVPNVPGHDESADVGLFDPVSEPLVLSIVALAGSHRSLGPR